MKARSKGDDCNVGRLNWLKDKYGVEEKREVKSGQVSEGTWNWGLKSSFRV